jgi:hypothetical protein
MVQSSATSQHRFGGSVDSTRSPGWTRARTRANPFALCGKWPTPKDLLTSYEEIEPVPSTAEARGRALVFDWTRSASGSIWTPADIDVLDLHRGMFATVFDWAGSPRTEARGPGGVVEL